MYFVSRPGVLPFPKDSGLKWSHYDLLRLLGMMPYAGARELAGVMSPGHELMYRRLWQLSDRGYVAKVELGATRPQVARWRILPEGRDILLPRTASGIWTGPWPGSWKWYRRWSGSTGWLPSSPPSWGSWCGSGGSGVQRGMRRRCTSTGGWPSSGRASCRAGGRLREMFNRLVTELENYNMQAGRSYPSVLCFVVSDAWQRELVTRVARTCAWTTGSRSGASPTGRYRAAGAPSRDTAGWGRYSK